MTSTDVVEKLTNSQYESEVPEVERDTYESLSNELSNSKQGAVYLINAAAGIVVGGIGGTAKTTKIDGKDVEVSTAGIGSRGELTKPYDPVQTRKDLEAVHGAENVSSTTVPKKPHQASSTRSDVITDVNGGKAVQVRLEDGSSKMIPYDNRGLAIFDDVVVFTTKIDQTKSYSGQMSQASKDMWEVIKNDSNAKSKFTNDQLEQLRLGKKQIDGYTWHHNPQSSPNTMQLVPDEFHSNKAVPHTGQNSLKNGK